MLKEGGEKDDNETSDKNWEEAFKALKKVSGLTKEAAARTINPIERVMNEFLDEMVEKNRTIEDLRRRAKKVYGVSFSICKTIFR